MLDLFGMRLLRDEVSNILLLTHLRGGGKSGQGLRNEELGIGLQAGESTDIRQRLVLFIIHYSLSNTMGRSRPTMESAVKLSLEATRVAYSVNCFCVKSLLYNVIPMSFQCHSNVILLSYLPQTTSTVSITTQ